MTDRAPQQSFNLSTPSRPPTGGPAVNGQAISAPLSASLNVSPGYGTQSPQFSRGLNGERPPASPSQANAYASPAPPTPGKKGKKAATMSTASSSKAIDGPVAMARWLKEGPPAAQMDIAKVKKLRMLLRQETTVCVPACDSIAP